MNVGPWFCSSPYTHRPQPLKLLACGAPKMAENEMADTGENFLKI
jgi:hypothetical protein